MAVTLSFLLCLTPFVAILAESLFMLLSCKSSAARCLRAISETLWFSWKQRVKIPPRQNPIAATALRFCSEVTSRYRCNVPKSRSSANFLNHPQRDSALGIIVRAVRLKLWVLTPSNPTRLQAFFKILSAANRVSFTDRPRIRRKQRPLNKWLRLCQQLG